MIQATATIIVSLVLTSVVAYHQQLSFVAIASRTTTVAGFTTRITKPRGVLSHPPLLACHQCANNKHGAVMLQLAKKDSNAFPQAADGRDDDKPTSKKTKRKSKRKTSSTTKEPPFWHNDKDAFILVSNGQVYTNNHRQCIDTNDGGDIDLSRRSIKFTIRGNPRVLIRHRTARGFTYNPSAKAQQCFRDCLLDMLPREYHPVIVDDNEYLYDDSPDDSTKKKKKSNKPTIVVPLFPSQYPLRMSITFRMKRPKSHFVNNKPGFGRLKSTAPQRISSEMSRSDIDNLIKFVLDSCNELLYSDDRQILCLNALKVLDTYSSEKITVDGDGNINNEDDGLCQGGTDVEISVLREDDL